MKYTVALIAAAVGANAWAKNVTYVTETVDQYTTFCPGPTHITHGSKTWTITEATTLTITDCPCTITKPVTTTPVVVCHTCAPPAPPPSHAPNNTIVAPPAPPPGGASATGAAPSASSPAVTAGAGKAMAVSGAGLAGIVGLAAFVL